MAGCRWRIGDGKNVNIWQDRWIPGHNALMAEEIVIRDDTRLLGVDALFQHNEKQWDITKLRALFNPNVVANILKVQLCSEVDEDKRLWSYERNGMFSVKSCYQFVFDQFGSQSAEASNVQALNVLWKHLWKMKVPNKIKIFAWRACKNGVPTRENLVQKHVLTEATCRLYFSDWEDITHAIVTCNSLQGLMQDYIPRRNKYTHDQLLLTPKQVAENVVSMLKSYGQVKQKTQIQLMRHYKWQPPQSE